MRTALITLVLSVGLASCVTGEAGEDEIVEDCEGKCDAGPGLRIVLPATGQAVPLDAEVAFHFEVGPAVRQIKAIADETFPFLDLAVPAGSKSRVIAKHRFSSAGERALVFEALDAAGGSLGRVSLPLRVEVADPGVHVDETPIAGCQNGVLTVVTVDPGADGKPRPMTPVALGSVALDQARGAVESRGLWPAALINGGYFFGDQILSYYKSSILQNQHSSNSAKGPRACLVSENGKVAIAQSTPQNFERWRKTSGIDVACAGPQLVEAGANVAQRQFAAENFSAGVGLRDSVPRSGVCITETGATKLFVAQSSSIRCGMSLIALADKMRAESCVSGMNLDGGGSSAISAIDNQVRSNGIEDRRVPVWLAIF